MDNERMLLNSDDSELLVAFETGKTVKYSIAKELDSKKLFSISKRKWNSSKYGVWWSRERFKDKKQSICLRNG